MVERIGQRTDLVTGVNVDFLLEFTCRDLLRTVRQTLNRRGDGFGKEK